MLKIQNMKGVKMFLKNEYFNDFPDEDSEVIVDKVRMEMIG